MDARALYVLANDLPAYDMLADDPLHACRIDPIIQSCSSARARGGRKPTSECRGSGEDLSHQDVRALRAASEAALPHELRPVARVLRDERLLEHFMK